MRFNSTKKRNAESVSHEELSKLDYLINNYLNIYGI